MRAGQVRMRLRTGALLALVCMTAWWAPEEANAQQIRRRFKDRVHVVQPKPVLQKGRFELAPRIGFSFNDALYQSIKVGVAGNYHISERVYVGAMFDWYNFGDQFGGQTEAFEIAQNETNAAPDAPGLNWMAGAQVGFVPIFGKFAMFNSGIVFYDIGVQAGVGWAESKTLQVPVGTGGVAGSIGVTSHIFLTEWLSLNVEVGDTIYFANLGGESTLSHLVAASVGVGIYLPSSVERTPVASEEGAQ